MCDEWSDEQNLSISAVFSLISTKRLVAIAGRGKKTPVSQQNLTSQPSCYAFASHVGTGMNNALYIGALALFVAGTAVMTYAESKRQSVVVEGKHVEHVRGRWGRTSERLVLRTSAGEMPILQFPVIGYFWGADDVYAAVALGDEIEVRIGPWPPRLINGSGGPPAIMKVY
jgi:hypothetical protein